MSKHDENMFGSAAWDTFNNDYDNSGIKENFGPEIESDKIEVVNTPVSELKSSAQTLLRLDIDKSGSMSGFTTAMNEALGRVKESIVTSIEYIKKDEAYRLSPRYQSDKEFWNEYIKNLKCKNKYEIPKDKKCKRVEKAIKKEVFEKISSFCCKNKISEYAFLLGIISVYFSKIFNEDEIIIGTPFLNRRKADKELEMMGMFIATLPINIIAKGEMTFIDVCKNINTTNLQCFKHSKYPYYEIQKAYQDFSKENINLYEIAFSYQINKLEVTLDGDTGKTTWITNDTQANPLLISYVNHFGENLLYYDFLLNCMNKNDIDDMHERIMGIIKQVSKDEAIEIKDITPLSETDKKLITQFNNTGSVGINNQTIVSKFNCIVDENKNKIALICGNKKITYEELNNKANNLCCNIQKEGIYGENIPIILDNEINFIISILGVLKSGNRYIPILPEESIDRVKYIIKDSKSKILITNTKYINIIKVNEDALLKYLKIRNTSQDNPKKHNNALFLTFYGYRMSQFTINKIVKRAYRKANLDDKVYTVHTLRHTCATLLYRAGVNLKTIQELLGHVQIDTTEIYTHLHNQEVLEVMSN